MCCRNSTLRSCEKMPGGSQIEYVTEVGKVVSTGSSWGENSFPFGTLSRTGVRVNFGTQVSCAKGEIVVEGGGKGGLHCGHTGLLSSVRHTGVPGAIGPSDFTKAGAAP